VNIVKPVTLEMKQAFAVRAMADKRFHRRGKVEVSDGESVRRVALSAFDAAVLAAVVFHVNSNQGYSFAGSRRIAELTGCAVSGVAKSIDKLKALKILIKADGKANKAHRLAPNWEAYPDLAVHSHEVERTVHSLAVESTVHSHEVSPPSTLIGVDEKGRNRNQSDGKGTLGASRARAALPGGRGGGSRGAPGAAAEVDDIMKALAKRQQGADA